MNIIKNFFSSKEIKINKKENTWNRNYSKNKSFNNNNIIDTDTYYVKKNENQTQTKKNIHKNYSFHKLEFKNNSLKNIEEAETLNTKSTIKEDYDFFLPPKNLKNPIFNKKVSNRNIDIKVNDYILNLSKNKTEIKKKLEIKNKYEEIDYKKIYKEKYNQYKKLMKLKNKNNLLNKEIEDIENSIEILKIKNEKLKTNKTAINLYKLVYKKNKNNLKIKENENLLLDNINKNYFKELKEKEFRLELDENLLLSLLIKFINNI